MELDWKKLLAAAVGILALWWIFTPTTCPCEKTITGDCLLECDKNLDDCYKKCDTKNDQCVKECYQRKAHCYMTCIGSCEPLKIGGCGC